jgi:nucleolar protein 9
MPRENRKRGKKHKKTSQDEPEPEVYQEDANYAGEERTGGFEGGDRPSWVVRDMEPQVNPEAPFGYVEADVKAYFRTVESQIRDWQDNPVYASAGPSGENENEQDPNEGNPTPPSLHRCLYPS